MEQISWGAGSATATATLADDASWPWIFLSHSGRQKPFVTKLYHALLHAKHRPFFDMDTIVSLPVGLDYPSRLFQACQACKMGVVVLSEEYVQNLWPMVELQHLLLYGSTDRLVYPLFYSLRPSDLSDPHKLAHWEECWAKQAAEWKWEDNMLEVQEYMASSGCKIQINLDRSSWSKILKVLKSKSGEVRQKVLYDVNDERTFQDRSEGEYIEAIVSNICAVLPAPLSLVASIKGGQRLHREMAEVFEQDESLGEDGVRRVGVYGIGGSGKSTLCKVMATFYSNQFGGRCYILEFPSNDNEIEKLLQNIKAILPALTLHSASIVNVCTIDQALDLLEEGLQANKVFLAIDNIWGHSPVAGHHSFDYAQRTMLMKCMPGSKILVTSRSKELLTRLFHLNVQEGNMMTREHSRTRGCPRNIVHVPSLTEVEAVQALKFYSSISYLIREDYLWRLARSCFFAGQCHPLYLKLKGVELRKKGRPSFNDQKWNDLFLSLEICGNAMSDDVISSEAQVLHVVEESFKLLPPQLQDVFIDLATAWEVDLGWSHSQLVRYQCDEYCTEDAMFYQVLELEYHGLLEFQLVEIHGHYSNEIGYEERLIIHDLHRSLAKFKALSGRHTNALIKHALICGNLSLLSSSEIASKKVVWGRGLKASTLASLLGSSSSWTTLLECLLCTRPGQVQAQTRVLRVHYCFKSHRIICPVRSLNLKGGSWTMEGLRALVLDGIQGVREIKGWEGVPNLVRLDLVFLWDLERIGSLGHLKWLEMLILRHCSNVQLQALVGDPCRKRCLVTVNDHLPKLQVLNVYQNDHLEELGSRFSEVFPTLKTLQLSGCDKLQSISNLSKAGSIRILDLSRSRRLQSIMEGGVPSLTALQHLNLESCHKLERIPDLSNLMGLQSFHVAGCRLSERIRLNCSHLNRLSLNQFKCNNTTDRRVENRSSILSLLGNAVLHENDQLFGSTGDLVNKNPFSKLQFLTIGAPWSPESMTSFSETCRYLEVSGLPSLEELRLSWFGSVQKLSISLSSLPNLERLWLNEFPLLEEIECLGAPHTLASVEISDCPLLKGVANMPISLCVLDLEGCDGLKDLSDLVALTSLQVLIVVDCGGLTDVSSLAALTSLISLELRLGSMSQVREIPDLKHLPFLTSLLISCPGPLWTLSGEAVRQVMMTFYHTTGCR